MLMTNYREPIDFSQRKLDEAENLLARWPDPIVTDAEPAPEVLEPMLDDHMPEIAVYEVASFYSMLETKPVGRHSISVCTNISCMLRGSDELLAHIEGKLGIKLGESTPDGRIYLKPEEECLAACCGAPMLMIDHKYYERLTTEKVDELLEALE